MWCSFVSNPIFLPIGSMKTQRNLARRLDEEISNEGAPPCGDQVPPLEEDANTDPALVNPHPLTDENIRTALLQMAQYITTQAQTSTAQAQAMTTQAKRRVVPHPHQVTTRASRLRYFTRKNPSTFYGFKVDEDPQEFIDEVSKILLVMEFSTSEKAELATYQLKDMS